MSNSNSSQSVTPKQNERGTTSSAALIVAILGSTMVFLDGSIVNIALPVMQRELRGSVAQMQWIVEAYALVLAALLLVGGALGDRFGRRRIFLLGGALFTLSSVACGLAPGALVLVIARSVQGIGGALLVPGSLALITAAYDEPERGRAIGIWSASSALTGAVAPLIGGWVIAHASWRWLFGFNLPLGILVTLAALRVDETRDEQAPKHIDFPGAIFAALGLGGIVFALLSWPTHGFPRAVWLPLSIGLVSLAIFVEVERRSRWPMVPLRLFRSSTFTGTNLLTLFLYAALGGAMFFLPFDLIQVQGYSPAEAGGAFVPFVILVSVMSRWAGGLVAKSGPRIPLIIGPILAGFGFLLLAWPSIGGNYFVTFFPGIFVLGVGMGLTVAPLTTTVMGAVGKHHAGVASGINNAVSRTAGLLAIAVFGAVMTARFNTVLDNELTHSALSTAARAAIDDQRGRLAGADLSAIEPISRELARKAINAAFVGGFRWLMILAACLGWASAGAGMLFVERGEAPVD